MRRPIQGAAPWRWKRSPVSCVITMYDRSSTVQPCSLCSCPRAPSRRTEHIKIWGGPDDASFFSRGFPRLSVWDVRGIAERHAPPSQG
jgi:hypothetical protein